jgi:hypothetical protein
VHANLGGGCGQRRHGEDGGAANGDAGGATAAAIRGDAPGFARM